MDRAACEEAADRSARRATPGMETGAVCGASHDGIQFLQPRLARCVPESVLEDSAWFRYQDLVADDGHRQHRGDLRRHRIRLAVGTHRQAPCHHLGGVACIAHYAVLGIRIHAPGLGRGCIPHAGFRARRLGHHPRAFERAVTAGDSRHLPGLRLPARQSRRLLQFTYPGDDCRRSRQQLRTCDGECGGHGGHRYFIAGGLGPRASGYCDGGCAAGACNRVSAEEPVGGQMAAHSDAINTAEATSAYPSSFAAWYSVAVLMLMYIFSFIDRTTISLLVEPMKRDLHISDTQIGMLQGLAFALLYTFLGLPIARLSDRHSRRAVIAAGVFTWSIMAALCGVARTATQLFLARVGVGIGEAALSPSAYSIITDSFPRARLGRAFAIYTIGIPIGAGIALLIGGIIVGMVSGAGDHYVLPLLGEVRAWQLVFIVTGAPGLLLPLLLLTFREPARRGLLAGKAGHATIGEVVEYAWLHRKFYSLHFLALALLALAGYAVGAWLPTALHRAYGV